MLSEQIRKLESENRTLREELSELKRKMEADELPKPKSCKYCKNFVQYYIKGGRAYTSEYVPIYNGHCLCDVPISKGKKRNPKPDDSCPYFELGNHENRTLL